MLTKRGWRGGWRPFGRWQQQEPRRLLLGLLRPRRRHRHGRLWLLGRWLLVRWCLLLLRLHRIPVEGRNGRGRHHGGPRPQQVVLVERVFQPAPNSDHESSIRFQAVGPGIVRAFRRSHSRGALTYRLDEQGVVARMVPGGKGSCQPRRVTWDAVCPVLDAVAPRPNRGTAGSPGGSLHHFPQHPCEQHRWHHPWA